MSNKDFKSILKSWNNFINEAYKNVNLSDIDEDKYNFGYKDEDYKNYEEISKNNTEFYKEFDLSDSEDFNKVEKFNLVDKDFGVNAKIMSIIRKLENYVKEERELKKDNSIMGRIKLYEDEDEGFVKFDFSELSGNRVVSSTIDFEGTDIDWPTGYGKGSYKVMLVHKSTLGFSSVLFEIMLEFISIVRDKGVCSDRNSVTVNSQKGWQIYANRNDIMIDQLDINKDEAEEFGVSQLNPEDVSDDTSQKLAYRHKGKEWYNSIFSKSIKKKNMNTIKYIANNSEYLELEFSVKDSHELLNKL